MLKMDKQEIIREIKEIMVDRLMLPLEADEIGDEILLFEQEDETLETLELDSVDSLEIMVGISNRFGVKIDPENNPEAFRNVSTLADAVLEQTHAGRA